MRSASSTGARSGDAHPTALKLPDWVQKWHAEHDAAHHIPSESNSGDEHPTVNTKYDAAHHIPSECNSGDEHPTADTSLSGPHNKWMRTLMEQMMETNCGSTPEHCA